MSSAAVVALVIGIITILVHTCAFVLLYQGATAAKEAASRLKDVAVQTGELLSEVRQLRAGMALYVSQERED